PDSSPPSIYTLSLHDALPISLERLEANQTLLIQSGKPVGVFETHADAPRVLLANSNLVPRWSTWEHFNELDRKGLMMYGQMTAGDRKSTRLNSSHQISSYDVF